MDKTVVRDNTPHTLYPFRGHLEEAIWTKTWRKTAFCIVCAQEVGKSVLSWLMPSPRFTLSKFEANPFGRLREITIKRKRYCLWYCPSFVLDGLLYDDVVVVLLFLQGSPGSRDPYRIHLGPVKTLMVGTDHFPLINAKAILLFAINLTLSHCSWRCSCHDFFSRWLWEHSFQMWLFNFGHGHVQWLLSPFSSKLPLN